MSTRLWCTNSF